MRCVGFLVLRATREGRCLTVAPPLLLLLLLLLCADTRDLKLPGEVFTFYLEHVLLVALPLIYLTQRRFNLFDGRVLYQWALMFLYHVDVLLVVSILAGGNINYMMVSREPWSPSCALCGGVACAEESPA